MYRVTILTTRENHCNNIKVIANNCYCNEKLSLRVVAIKSEALDLCNQKFIAINYEYCNDFFVAIKFYRNGNLMAIHL